MKDLFELIVAFLVASAVLIGIAVFAHFVIWA